ncbi:putative non-specific serine/threonine protein kinase [Helianthus anomalus]
MQGHVRNIHFPFDTDNDTSIAVASEMVEELDLTDQDVSTIAEMIDAEIRSCIPDWAPRDFFDDQEDNEPTASVDSTSSDHPAENESTSPLTVKPCSAPALLALERLPSGRRYWSDSPKGCFTPPFRPVPSNYSEENTQKTDETSPEREDDDDDDKVEVIVEKLENLLIEQQKELEELKRKHGLVVSDILKKLPSKTRQQVVNICKVEIIQASDHEM